MPEEENNAEKSTSKQSPQAEAPKQAEQSERIPDWQLKTINVKRGFDTLSLNKDKITKKGY